MERLVYGVGVNDADYPVQKFETIGLNQKGNRVRKVIWTCPFYQKWKSMLQRCYSTASLIKYPSYLGCSVIPEWHHFMTFRGWMESLDWEGKHLDKDILFPGNKVYSPETCVFVDAQVNAFIVERKNTPDKLPTGVSYSHRHKKYRAHGCNIINGKNKTLGYYETCYEAQQAWLSYKLEQAKILAQRQVDYRVGNAIISRYENYQL